MTAMRSAIANTSARRWDTKIEATPRALRRAQPIEQPLRLASGQRRSRLIEDQQSDLLGEGPRDQDQLLGGEVERSHLGLRLGIDAEVGEGAGRLGVAQVWSTNPNRDGSAPRYMFCATVRSGQTLTSCGTIAMPARSASATFLGSIGRAGELIVPS